MIEHISERCRKREEKEVCNLEKKKKKKTEFGFCNHLKGRLYVILVYKLRNGNINKLSVFEEINI
jgi:hypothetical protein